MTVLRFPASRRRYPGVPERLASLEILLGECLGRQERLREEGRRLRASVGRLRRLARQMARSQDCLRRSIGRLRACHRSIGPFHPTT